MEIEVLREALIHVKKSGFGDEVDYDSIIEEAAQKYLAILQITRN